MSNEIIDIGMTLEKVLIEVRYDKSLLFDEVTQLNKIAKKNREFFPQYGRDEQNKVLGLQNPMKRSFANILQDRSSVDIDIPDSYSDFVKISQNTLNHITQELEIDSFNRLGIRFFVGKEYPSIPDAWDIIKERFLNMDDVFESEDVQNPNIQFVFVRDEIRINVSVRVESVTSIEVNVDSRQQQNHQNKHMILFDIDVFQQQRTEIENLEDFYGVAHEHALSVLKTLKTKLNG